MLLLLVFCTATRCVSRCFVLLSMVLMMLMMLLLVAFSRRLLVRNSQPLIRYSARAYTYKVSHVNNVASASVSLCVHHLRAVTQRETHSLRLTLWILL